MIISTNIKYNFFWKFEFWCIKFDIKSCYFSLFFWMKKPWNLQFSQNFNHFYQLQSYLETKKFIYSNYVIFKNIYWIFKIIVQLFWVCCVKVIILFKKSCKFQSFSKKKNSQVLHTIKIVAFHFYTSWQ